MNEKPFVHSMDKLLNGLSSRIFNLDNNGLLIIPPELYYVIEMETLNSLNPTTITSNFLLSVEEDVFTL